MLGAATVRLLLVYVKSMSVSNGEVPFPNSILVATKDEAPVPPDTTDNGVANVKDCADDAPETVNAPETVKELNVPTDVICGCATFTDKVFPVFVSPVPASK